MLVDAFSELGFESILVEDGHQDALDVDFLLLVGEGSHFPKYAGWLSGHAGRPVTILWNLEALLPPTVLDSIGTIDAVPAGILRHVVRPGLILQRARQLMPQRLRTWLRQAARWTLFPRLRLAALGDEFFSEPQNAELALAIAYRCAWYRRHASRRWIDLVFACTAQQRQLLTHLGYPSRLAPVGYHPAMGTDHAGHRDIDVLFIGYVANGSRRRTVLDTVRRALERQGLNVLTRGQGLYGAPRNDLLNRARISLNISNHPWDLPAMRFLMSMGCGALIVSDPLDDPAPYRVGEHFVQAEIADLPDTIGYYLRHEAERQAIARRAHHFIETELTLQRTVSEMIADAREAACQA